MNNIKKFTVTLVPFDFQTDLKAISLEINVLKFNDGSIRVTIPDIFNYQHSAFKITTFIESMDDLMIVAQIKDILTRNGNPGVNSFLEITSTPYTRYDRVMYDNSSDAFGLKVFADMLNSLKFTTVLMYDVHNEYATFGLINNFINHEQTFLVNDLVGGDYNQIAPDKGALKKKNKSSIIFDKVRDVTTGEIKGIELIENTSIDNLPNIVVDDICEGGRTFIELAKVYNRNDSLKSTPLSLYVTHGIFSNNAISKLTEYYDKIYVYFMKLSVYNELTQDQKNKLVIQYLVEL